MAQPPQPPAPPWDLRVAERFANPLGFHDPRPGYSWKLPAGTLAQTACEIAVATTPELLPARADVWASGRIELSATSQVPHGGRALRSRERLFWRVRFWDETGAASPWSETATLEMGLLKNQDWRASWIGLADHGATERTAFDTPLFRPARFRREFEVPGPVASARLHLTAKGVCEASLNGEAVGDDRLAPGWTPYTKRIETRTHDVTRALRPGANAIGLELAEGWYAGRMGSRPRHWVNDRPPMAMAQLEITLEDGRTQTLRTDAAWRATLDGPRRSAGLYDGERHDQRLETPGWNRPGFDDRGWERALAAPLDPRVALRPKRHAPIRDREVLPARRLHRLGSDRVLFDLGQNMVGVPRLAVPARAGETLTVRVAEALDPDGSLHTKSYGTAESIDRFTPAKSGTVRWQPRFTFHGFRYVQLSGFDPGATPDLSWVQGVVQHSDFAEAGAFETSSPSLNQLQRNIVWGLRGNFLDVPLDCPQRSERLGWTGDAQVFLPTAVFNADTHAFWAAWLQSLREEQFDDGGLPVVVPNVTGRFSQAGWSDAAVIVPWELFWRTGDRRVLEDNWEMMLGWLAYSDREAVDGISHMWTVGDWLQPHSRQEDDRRGDTSHALLSTAYWARSLELSARAAEVLGHTHQAEAFAARRAGVCRAFEAAFFDADGRHVNGPETQTAYLLALGFGLLSPTLRKRAGEHLVRTVAEADGHLRTGFLGTPLLAPVLDRIGRADLAFDLLFRESFPSWFFSIAQGATTVWERWDGYTREGGVVEQQASLNHYAYGAIGEWMYERIAGIAPLAPGYRSLRLAPLVGGPLTHARGHHDTPHGRVDSAWSLRGDRFEHRFTVPPNTTALVELPPTHRARPELLAEPSANLQAEAQPGTQSTPFRWRLGPGRHEVRGSAG